jgi:hypothetical protein
MFLLLNSWHLLSVVTALHQQANRAEGRQFVTDTPPGTPGAAAAARVGGGAPVADEYAFSSIIPGVRRALDLLPKYFRHAKQSAPEVSDDKCESGGSWLFCRWT